MPFCTAVEKITEMARMQQGIFSAHWSLKRVFTMRYQGLRIPSFARECRNTLDFG
ncbi:conserved hypothetical protein [delta proteobacterium NaphS2]|nr:conserved hypothetical protein [delta proteobacterium NaphS2]